MTILVIAGIPAAVTAPSWATRRWLGIALAVIGSAVYACFALRLPGHPVARPERTQIGESGASPLQAETGCPAASRRDGRISRAGDLGGRMGSRPAW